MYGEKEEEGLRIDGLEEGLWTYWSEEGEKSEERNYKAGKRHGLQLSFCF